MNIKDYKQAAEELKGFSEWAMRERVEYILSKLTTDPKNDKAIKIIKIALSVVDMLKVLDLEGIEKLLLKEYNEAMRAPTPSFKKGVELDRPKLRKYFNKYTNEWVIWNDCYPPTEFKGPDGSPLAQQKKYHVENFQ